jgi:thiamine pyrophosphokinase
MKNNLQKILINKIKENGKSILVFGPLFIPKKIILSTLNTQKPSLIILVDRGNHHIKMIPKKYKKICLSVGDGDSNIENKLDITLNPKKDHSDLDFVVDAIIKSKSTKSISALGFCACYEKSTCEERFDHFLFNLGSFRKLSIKLSINISVDHKFNFLPKGKQVHFYSGIFSLISFRNQKIKIYGDVEYPLTKWKRIHSLSSLALSNIAKGKFVIESSADLVLYKAL